MNPGAIIIATFFHHATYLTTMGDLHLSQFEARIKFDSDADLSWWSGNTLRSGFGVHLRSLVCTKQGLGGQREAECRDCPLRSACVYDFFYNSSPPEGVKVLRKQGDIPRPFVFDPPSSGRHATGCEAIFRFTLFGRAAEFLPYFLLALRNLGETGMSRGYRLGKGRFHIESVDSIGYGARTNIFSGGTVFNRAIDLCFQDILKCSAEHSGNLTLRFLSPAQIKENERFTATPTFRGLISRLLFRANALAEFYGSGMLYDNERVLELLGGCRTVSTLAANIHEIRPARFFHKQKIKMQHLPPFFKGEITYHGDFSADLMAILELGMLIHVGKMATFGNGLYEIEI